MRRNVAAGIGSNEQGEYCRAALQRSDRKEPRYKWPTLLLLLRTRYLHIGEISVLMSPKLHTYIVDRCFCCCQ